MSNIYKTSRALVILIIMTMLTNCKKQDDWLNVKSNKASVVPLTITDFQALLNNNITMNNLITTGIVSADNLNIADVDIPGLYEAERNLYLWNKTVWVGGIAYEWNYYYKAIEVANLVLDGLSNLDSSTPGINNVRGQAYFFRSWFYYNLAQIFCKPYDSKTAGTELGLPIRLTSDVNVLAKRSTLQALYDQMLQDARLAASLLSSTQIYLQRPTSIAAKALIAKIYFVEQNYADAQMYSNDVLSNKSTLIDFNNTSVISSNNAYKFPANGTGNPEIIFYAEGAGYVSTQGFLGNIGIVDPILYSTYSNNDLRKGTFFGISSKGNNIVASYTGNFNVFCGFATNEMFLIRSESNARLGKITEALNDLNALLVTRYKTGTYVPLSANDQTSAIQLIINERRKEMPNTGSIRWEDLRRINLDPKFQVTVTRTYKGIVYSLLPNDLKYVLPIPDQEIQISGIEQNPGR